MSNRVEVDVIEMAGEVLVVPDRVFPEPPLPEGMLALAV